MGFDELFGVVGRSVLRHAVVGLLTGGTGNVFLMAADALDFGGAMDAMDAVSAVSDYDCSDYSHSSSHHDIHFGGELASHSLTLFTPTKTRRFLTTPMQPMVWMVAGWVPCPTVLRWPKVASGGLTTRRVRPSTTVRSPGNVSHHVPSDPDLLLNSC